MASEGEIKVGHIEPIKADKLRINSARAVALQDIRCGKCQKLLFRGSEGSTVIEMKCPRCGHMNRWG